MRVPGARMSLNDDGVYKVIRSVFHSDDSKQMTHD